MGNQITSKIVDISILGASLLIFIFLGLPFAQSFLSEYNIQYYRWEPPAPIASLVDTSKMPPAKAVPILMYHGVVEESEEANTSIENFIGQMEMLKREGWETISLTEYDLFRQGQLTLPPKAIVITFDDGRKDSYYTTDDVLRQLGFRATIFVATAKAIEEEPFYLNWEDLRRMRDSGRWEIEAHGRHSHEKVAISSAGTEEEYGRYLTSRRWLAAGKRLETVAEFQKRVEQDYLDNIRDIKANLGLDAKYLAVPLNDYGQLPVSNNPEATAFNHEVVKKYFRMAFIEANSSERVESFSLPVYNYKNDDPYLLRRIEVKNMKPDVLKKVLDSEFPSSPSIELKTADTVNFLKETRLDYGYMTITSNKGLNLRTLSPNASAKVDFGDLYWDAYDLSAVMERKSGRSIALNFYAKDEKNYLSFGLSDNGLFLRRRVGGKDSDLRPSVLLSREEQVGRHTYRIAWRDGRISAFFDDRLIFANVPVGAMEGSASIKIWGDKEIAEGLIQSIKISPAHLAQTS